MSQDIAEFRMMASRQSRTLEWIVPRHSRVKNDGLKTKSHCRVDVPIYNIILNDSIQTKKNLECIVSRYERI